jgi:hypothetical protein
MWQAECWNYFFDPKDGGDMFLRNVGWHSTDYTMLHPRSGCSSEPPLWKPQILQSDYSLYCWILLSFDTFWNNSLVCKFLFMNSSWIVYMKYDIYWPGFIRTMNNPVSEMYVYACWCSRIAVLWELPTGCWPTDSESALVLCWPLRIASAQYPKDLWNSVLCVYKFMYIARHNSRQRKELVNSCVILFPDPYTTFYSVPPYSQ